MGVHDRRAALRSGVRDVAIRQATGYIKRQAAGNKPFFTYIALSHMHPPEAVHPDFDQTSPARPGQYAEYSNIKTGEEFNGY